MQRVTAALPSGWSKVASPSGSGDVYYVNEAGVMQFDHPTHPEIHGSSRLLLRKGLRKLTLSGAPAPRSPRSPPCPGARARARPSSTGRAPPPPPV